MNEHRGRRKRLWPTIGKRHNHTDGGHAQPPRCTPGTGRRGGTKTQERVQYPASSSIAAQYDTGVKVRSCVNPPRDESANRSQCKTRRLIRKLYIGRREQTPNVIIRRVCTLRRNKCKTLTQRNVLRPEGYAETGFKKKRSTIRIIN